MNDMIKYLRIAQCLGIVIGLLFITESVWSITLQQPPPPECPIFFLLLLGLLYFTEKILVNNVSFLIFPVILVLIIPTLGRASNLLDFLVTIRWDVERLSHMQGSAQDKLPLVIEMNSTVMDVIFLFFLISLLLAVFYWSLAKERK